MADVDKKAPQFWSDNPAVHFELMSAKFQQLLDSGKTFDALSLVQSKLTPISNQHTALQTKLKACNLSPMLCLSKVMLQNCV